MREIKNLREIYQFALKAKNHGKSVGLVTTMGALHEGHFSLIAAAKKNCDIVVVSIFVNPIQFAPNEDYKNYPRDLKKDKKQLEKLAVDVLFVPDAGQMFPRGFKTYVDVKELSKKMCGKTRPGHFEGVATVVAKLFNLVVPDKAFFGEKDFQQQVIIKAMVSDLNLPVEIVSLPIVREFDGLAMSSRNRFLNEKEKNSAAILYRALCLAKEMVNGGERDPRKIIFRMRSLISSEPSVRIDYLLAVDPETLDEVPRISGKTLFAIAAHIGRARLIDNLTVKG